MNKKRESYFWLVGVDLGGYIYNGKYYVDNKPCQYQLINNQCMLLLDYKEFKKYISAFDLSEYKKAR